MQISKGHFCKSVSIRMSINITDEIENSHLQKLTPLNNLLAHSHYTPTT